MPPDGEALRSLPHQVAGLTGLSNLELRCRVLAEDTLAHLAPLTGLTSLRVVCMHVGGAAGPTSFPSALLAHLGALSGLTRLADIAVRVTVEKDGDVMLAPGDLLRALPLSPSLARVRTRHLEGRLTCTRRFWLLLAAGSSMWPMLQAVPCSIQPSHCPVETRLKPCLPPPPLPRPRVARWRWGRWIWTAAPT